MWTLLAAVALCVCWPFVAFAHNAPIPIAVWGDFPPAEANCQRIVARSAATCALQAWKLSESCLRLQLNGEVCDTAATEVGIERAHTDAIAVAGAACRNVDLTTLGYASIIDMNIDIDIFCQDLQQAMETAVYGPALSHGEIQPVDAPTRTCIENTSDATERLLQAAFHSRRRIFDHIASDRFTPSHKFSSIATSTNNIKSAQQRMQTRLAAQCPTFATLYPRPLVPYLTLIAERGDCLSGRVYVQDFIICPESVCGNGMREPGERCDDGNTVSGDGCRADCQAQTP